MSEIRPIDAIAFEKKIQQHDLWNKEGVIELIRSMPTIGESSPEDCSKCALNTDHGKICSAYKCEFTSRQEGEDNV